MLNVLIVGAGQLGSRHLQSVLQSDLCGSVCVVDPSLESLDLARSRADEVKSNVYTSYKQSIPSNENYFLVIIATSSDVRAKIVNDVLESNTVKNMLLEKVLFQSECEYLAVDDLIKEHGISTWVNCPMRSYNFFQSIKHLIDTNSQTTLSVKGMEWGLACNAIHFLDLFEFLTGDDINFFDSKGLVNEIYPSKRAGYVEFYGELQLMSENRQVLLSCERGAGFEREILIKSGKYEVAINEKSNEAVIKSNSEITEVISLDFPFQSELTAKIIEQLHTSETCNLTPYVESMRQHLILIRGFCDFSESVLNHAVKKINIT